MDIAAAAALTSLVLFAVAWVSLAKAAHGISSVWFLWVALFPISWPFFVSVKWRVAWKPGLVLLGAVVFLIVAGQLNHVAV